METISLNVIASRGKIAQQVMACGFRENRVPSEKPWEISSAGFSSLELNFPAFKVHQADFSQEQATINRI